MKALTFDEKYKAVLESGNPTAVIALEESVEALYDLYCQETESPEQKPI